MKCKHVTRDVRDEKAETQRINKYYHTLRIHDQLRRSGYTLKIKWERVWDAECRRDPAVCQFFENQPYSPPPILHDRDALYGGRTSTFKSYYKCGEAEKINYVDFQSLYPAVLCFKKYPLGHPKVHTSDATGCPPLDQIEGLIACTVLPPRDLYMPLLPWRGPQGRLLFVLCRTCGETQNHAECPHEQPEQRQLHGTWPAPEVRKAVELGYTIIKVDEIWNYPDRAEYDMATGVEGLFSGFIKHWVRKRSNGMARVATGLSHTR